MERRGLLDLLVTTLLARRPPGRPMKVGLDGRSAAGKTMLANELASALGDRRIPTLRASLDAFHHPRQRRYQQGEFSARGYYEDAFDYAAVASALLTPLSSAGLPAKCRLATWDLRADAPSRAGEVQVERETILLFDGLFLYRGELDSHWDLRILVDIDAGTSIRRGIARDAALLGSGEAARRKYTKRYEPAWRMYERIESPLEKSDIIVDNSDPADPHVLLRPRQTRPEETPHRPRL